MGQPAADASRNQAVVPDYVARGPADWVWHQQAEKAWVEAHTGPNACAARALYALLLRARAEDPADRISAADLAAGAHEVLMYLLARPADAA